MTVIDWIIIWAILSIITALVWGAVTHFGQSDISNCHHRAHGELERGDAELICFEYTAYSKLSVHSARWYWMPIRHVGTLVAFVGWHLIHLGEMMRSGRWFHASWISNTGHHEFVPETEKVHRWLPPYVFRGRVQQVERRQGERRNQTL